MNHEWEQWRNSFWSREDPTEGFVFVGRPKEQLDLTFSEQITATKELKDWLTENTRDYRTDGRYNMIVVLIPNEEDAAMFKLRFG